MRRSRFSGSKVLIQREPAGSSSAVEIAEDADAHRLAFDYVRTAAKMRITQRSRPYP